MGWVLQRGNQKRGRIQNVTLMEEYRDCILNSMYCAGIVCQKSQNLEPLSNLFGGNSRFLFYLNSCGVWGWDSSGGYMVNGDTTDILYNFTKLKEKPTTNPEWGEIIKVLFYDQLKSSLKNYVCTKYSLSLVSHIQKGTVFNFLNLLHNKCFEYVGIWTVPTWFSDVIENVNSFVGNKVPISISNIHELSHWPVSLNRQKKVDWLTNHPLPYPFSVSLTIPFKPLTILPTFLYVVHTSFLTN